MVKGHLGKKLQAGVLFRLTAEELDFILNYDIKYRLGRDAGDEAE